MYLSHSLLNPNCSLQFFNQRMETGEIMTNQRDVGADKVRWDLTVLYKALDDPRLISDLDYYEQLAVKFAADFRGRLNMKLGDALTAYKELNAVGNVPMVYLSLRRALGTNDQTVKQFLNQTLERLSLIEGQYLVFFELEVAALSQEDIDRQAQENEVVRNHLPLLAKIRLFKDHFLSEEVEQALTKREPFSASSWANFFDEVEADLEVKLGNENITITEALHRLAEDKSIAERAKILFAMHEALGGFFLKYSAETLMNIVRAKALEDTERHFPHHMSSRNMSNRLSDEVVEALHGAVARVAAPIMRQHYRLKAAHLRLPRLAWSDRNAKLPFDDDTIVPFAEAQRIVLEAYKSFSPTLAALVEQQFTAKRIDAPHYASKDSGAFNLSICLPGDEPISFTFLNYLGSLRDVATLAHELGHGVHGLLAGQAQGGLMMHAPMAYAETASIFGEMVTFKHLMQDLLQKQKKSAALALLMNKCDDFANTVVRQIGLSQFERRLHGANRRFSPDEINAIWLETIRDFYGADGDVFTYEHADRLWSYIGHFHRPFYVYAYAVGEIFTQSLFARHEDFGAQFEPLYLDLLRAGMTKDAIELLQPFGLDPREPSFWEAGIKTSFGAWVTEAARLSEKMGIKV
jgi:oligoendopeptidase F